MTESRTKKGTLTTQSKRTKSRELKLRERDREILKLVYSHRFLSTELLWHLLKTDDEPAQLGEIGADGKRRPKRYAFGRQALYKRLLQLNQAGYLNREYIYEEPRKGNGIRESVYGLGSKSGKILAETVGIDPRDVRYIVEANKVKSNFRKHAVEVARFRVILELACRGSNGKVRLLFWEQGTKLRDKVYGKDHRGEEKRFSVDPDAFFGLEVEGKGRAHYFLEVDRGTMPIVSESRNTDIRNKIFAFYYYRKSEKYTKRYRYATLPSGEIVGLNVLNQPQSLTKQEIENLKLIRGFTVLFLTTGKINAHGKPSGRIANMLSIFPNLGKIAAAKSFFCFSVPDLLSPDIPESVFETVWITPNPEYSLASMIQ